MSLYNELQLFESTNVIITQLNAFLFYGPFSVITHELKYASLWKLLSFPLTVDPRLSWFSLVRANIKNSQNILLESVV